MITYKEVHVYTVLSMIAGSLGARGGGNWMQCFSTILYVNTLAGYKLSTSTAHAPD